MHKNASKVCEKFTYYFKEAIKVEVSSNLFNSKQTIFICLKEKNIPILQIKKPIDLNQIEREASKIASYLNLPLKGI